MIRQWLTRFMAGRYGEDQLNVFLMVLYIALYVGFLFTRLLALEILSVLLLLLTLLRTLSRNPARRRAENARFLQLVRPAARRFNTFCSRIKDREHRYFKCPNCGQQMRVPRGKGRITVHCRSCGATFEEKC